MIQGNSAIIIHYIVQVPPSPIPFLQLSSLIIAVVKVAAVAQHERGDERPEIDAKAGPRRGHLHPGGRPGVLEVL